MAIPEQGLIRTRGPVAHLVYTLAFVRFLHSASEQIIRNVAQGLLRVGQCRGWAIFWLFFNPINPKPTIGPPSLAGAPRSFLRHGAECFAHPAGG